MSTPRNGIPNNLRRSKDALLKPMNNELQQSRCDDMKAWITISKSECDAMEYKLAIFSAVC